MLDNIEVALLTKVNRLADAFGLKAYDFQARLVPDPAHDTYALSFSEPITADPLRRDRYARMLAAIGVEACGRIEADYVQLIDGMDAAVQRAERVRDARRIRGHLTAVASEGEELRSR